MVLAESRSAAENAMHDNLLLESGATWNPDSPRSWNPISSWTCRAARRAGARSDSWPHDSILDQVGGGSDSNVRELNSLPSGTLGGLHRWPSIAR